MMTRVLTWFLVGFFAGLGDYAFAIGYGLCASIIAVSVLNVSPKHAVAAIVTSQAISSLPAVLFHYRARNIESLNVPKPLLYFIGFTSLLSFIFAELVANIPKSMERILYTLVLLSALILMEVKKRFKIRNRYAIPLFSLLAALDKSVVGGGLSLIFVMVQSSLGINLASAIATVPLLKLLPTLSTFVGYLFSLKHFPWIETLAMTCGAITATPLSSKLLNRFKPSDNFLKLIIIIAILLNTLREVLGL